ncbi:hypothetical protein Tco_0717278 [Tanacetum coccineum]
MKAAAVWYKTTSLRHHHLAAATMAGSQLSRTHEWLETVQGGLLSVEQLPYPLCRRVGALVQRLINEDKGRQDVLLNLDFQFEDSCAVRNDLDKMLGIFEALVQRLINEDKGRQDVLLDLAFQFEDSGAVRDDLRKTYEKCNDIS